MGNAEVDHRQLDIIDPETGESTDTLVPTVNGRYLLNGEYVDGPNLDDNGAPQTLVAVRSNDYTLHADKKDNIPLENNLMNVYYEDMISPENWKDYPSGLKTFNCAAIDCSGDNQIYNSNSYYNDVQVAAGQQPSSVVIEGLLPGHPDHIANPDLLEDAIGSYAQRNVEGAVTYTENKVEDTLNFIDEAAEKIQSLIKTNSAQ